MRSCVLRTLLLLPVFLALNVSTGLAQGMTRVEQDDPSITYSGNWYSNESAGHSRGVATLTNAPGARASISFTGTGITWVGVMDGWSGLATVYLDGSMKVVNSYADPADYQHAIYTARGLTSGTHTLTIEVTHERAEGTDGSWVWIDAFDIENGSGVPGGITATTGRVEENHPALHYAGRWYSNANPEHSGGSAVLATDAGSRATINFNGTGVSWMAYRDEWSGIARVYVDGELKTTIDNYLSPSKARAVPYTTDGLPSGTHALTIEVTGTRNESSKGSWIWLDSFEVVR
jgi:hypothetical protein